MAQGFFGGSGVNDRISSGGTQQQLRRFWQRPASAFLLPLGLCSLLLVLTSCMSRSLASLQIIPAAGSVSISTGQTSQFQVLGTYTEGGHSTVTNELSSQVSWSSSNPAVATVSATGLATGVSPGVAVISATAQGAFGIVSATSNITVAAPGGGSGGGTVSRVLSSIVIIPGNQTVTAANETAQFIAIGNYASGNPATQDVTGLVTWQSSDSQVVRVNSSGFATGVGVGAATISALATSPDGSVVTASAMFSDAQTTPGAGVPTLTIYTVGTGSGTVTDDQGVIDCKTQASIGCTASIAAGHVVTLTAVPDAGMVFHGWSSNCVSPAATPADPYPATCQITMNTTSAGANATVGAIFDVVR